MYAADQEIAMHAATNARLDSSVPDLAEQARAGHGVPSQDPDPSAQYPIEHDRSMEERRTVFMGAGVMAGAVAGAIVGTAVAGPVGIVGGATAGAIAGALGGAAIGLLPINHRRT